MICVVCNKRIRWWHRFELHMGNLHWVPGTACEVQGGKWVCSFPCYSTVVSAYEEGLEWIYDVGPDSYG